MVIDRTKNRARRIPPLEVLQELLDQLQGIESILPTARMTIAPITPATTRETPRDEEVELAEGPVVLEVEVGAHIPVELPHF